MQKKNIFYILLSFIVSVILIWFLLSKIEIKDLFEIFSKIYYPAFLAFVVIALTSALLRAWRYKWLLHPSSISWGNIFLVTFVRNLFVDLFPARIGSLSYIYILNRRLNFSFEAATSTFVVSFVFDFLTLSPFLIFSIFFVGFGNTALSSISLLVISTIFFFLVFIILWKITQLSVFMLKIYRLFLKSIRLKEKKWAKVSTEKIRLTIEDIKQIKKRKIYWPIFFLSLGIRLAKYGSLYLLLFSLLKSHGFSLKTLSFCKTILGTTGAEMTGALPIKGIAGFGTWESAWALTFKLMNFEPSLAIMSGIGIHLITNLFEYFLGIISIIILAFPFIKKAKHMRF